jgi:flagellar biosynthetic protein FliP
MGPAEMKRYFILAAVAVCFWPGLAFAQSVNIDLGSVGQAGATSKLIQLTALITVLSLLRSALSVQGTPPNTVLIGLALFLTFFVMQPTLQQSWSTGIVPMSQGEIPEMEGLEKAAVPFHQFMARNVRSEDLNFFLDLGHMPPAPKSEATPWRALVPAFLISELRRAFEMGFLIFLPFLVIDIVVGSVLMSLGMMMLPPSAVSLPFKLIFFVTIDGWRLVAGSLVQSFGGSS